MSRGRDLAGRAGCVRLGRSRQTGHLVGVYRSRDQGLDEGEPGEFATPWTCVCEEHGTTMGHRTRALAEYHAAAPEGWCEDCQDEAEAKRLA